ncbi:hypothetical protein FZEAL_1088 [Fusarium zealandicum]|uniref:4Fe-4S ferredoxin-type domain-containing protein n=1 Tax=Fusarium zealandicum TaxID=1053134 RepID=A0A8H4UTI3_9HYPO|nr:hypothetical protein FZEAL_1088 [Fusarium zealandicum]
MHFTKAAKAVFLIVNHVLAAHVPPSALLRAHLWHHGSKDPHSHVAVSSSGDLPSNLFARQQPEACNRCRDRCPRGKIIDPDDCTNCVRCRAGTKPDLPKKRCIADPDGKRKQLPKKQENMRKDYFDKERRLRNKIEPKKREWNDKRDQDKRRMARRVGRCLPLVAMGMGAEAATQFGDDFFDEDYLESMDLVGLWPENLPIEAWESEESDNIFESDEYIDEWVKAGNDSPEGIDKRSLLRHARDAPAQPNDPVAVDGSNGLADSGQAQQDSTAATALILSEHDNHLEKRIFWIPIFLAIGKTIAALGVGIARGAAKGLSKTSVRVAKGRGSKKTRKEQHQGADKISQARRFRSCLMKRSP